MICKNKIIKKRTTMWTLITTLLVLWGLGVTSIYSFSEYIHILLIFVAVLLIVKYFTGRNRLYKNLKKEV
ncbi:MAG: lmo0937 family membrane protein [Ignavibacteria bacterium]|nr:lmo0937 family membrane protein [Ignavibacteria bacterium]